MAWLEIMINGLKKSRRGHCRARETSERVKCQAVGYSGKMKKKKYESTKMVTWRIRATIGRNFRSIRYHWREYLSQAMTAKPARVRGIFRINKYQIVSSNSGRLYIKKGTIWQRFTVYLRDTS